MWNTIARLGDGRPHVAKLTLLKRRLGLDNSKKPVNPSADEVTAYLSQAS